MGSALEKTPDFTPEAYLAWESEQSERHEYVNGEVFLMTGTTTAHNVICQNLLVALKNGLRGRPCRVYIEAIKLHVDAANCYFYPDLMVTCSPRDRNEPRVQSEPSVVVEVLSESTAGYDLGMKFTAYRQLPSLQEYVLVAQDEARVLVYRRGEGVEWVLHPYGPGETLHLPSLNLFIPVDELYDDIEFSASPFSSPPTRRNLMIESHDLFNEFPEHQDTIRTLLLSSDDFANMMKDYTEVDRKVARIEQRLDPASDLYAEEMKYLRVRLKDRLYKMLVDSAKR